MKFISFSSKNFFSLPTFSPFLSRFCGTKIPFQTFYFYNKGWQDLQIRNFNLLCYQSNIFRNLPYMITVLTFSTVNLTIIRNFEYWSMSLIAYKKGYFIKKILNNELEMFIIDYSITKRRLKFNWGMKYDLVIRNMKTIKLSYN